jgi:hypothetical protein
MKNLFKYLLIAILALFVISGIVSTCQDEKPKTAEQIERENESGAYLVSQDFIKRNLKAPSTATFAKHNYGEDPARVVKLDNGNYGVSIWVDSQNGFGAMIRTKFVLEVKPNGGDMWSLVSINSVN